MRKTTISLSQYFTLCLANTLIGTILPSPAIAEQSLQPVVQTGIPLIAKMPAVPSPFQIRDWRQATRDYTQLVFDFERRGELLPVIRWNDDSHATFFLPSYVGGNGPEALNCLAAVLSGSLIGLDMTNYQGRNYVKMTQAYFNPLDGVYTNNIRSRAGGSFWYDLFPNVLFYQLADRYPTVGDTQKQFDSVANQWYRAYEAMGGKSNPPTLPQIDHTAFRFETMTPVDNGNWIEPEGIAGIAWLEYMAYVKRRDPRYRTAADSCLRALEQRPVEKNPLYEVLLPYGALTAVRMNAELGTKHDVAKLVNWCFVAGDNRSARPGWGVITDRFGTMDCYGLPGSVTDTQGYAFAMNAFQWAGAITPIARYDSRYAHDIGKWMLHLTNASRLFYPASLPTTHQDNRVWADQTKTSHFIAYEGLRKQALRHTRDGEPFRTSDGQLKMEGHRQTVTSALRDGAHRLEQIWRFTVPAGSHQELVLFARCMAQGLSAKGIRFLWSSQPDGPYSELFTVPPADSVRYYGSLMPNAGRQIYLKAVAVEGSGPETLQIDSVYIKSQDANISPYATGDAMANEGPSNLCLYGSSHVGILGGIVGRTSDEKILLLDLLKTDYFHAKAFPTYLLYNPYPTTKNVTFLAGKGKKDIYDTVTHRFLKRNVSGTASVTLPARSAAVLVLAPTAGKPSRVGRRLLIDGVIVDYSFP